jgi:hypothetical protein
LLLGDVNLHQKKKEWGQNILIYRLYNGTFVPKDYDEEAKKAKELEAERKRRKEEEQKAAEDGIGLNNNNIKSRRALQMAIDNKTTPRVIKNLNIAMNFIFIALLILASVEFTLITNQFSTMLSNYQLIVN